MSALLKILVVANPVDQAELVSAVRSAGSPLSEARLISGVGDDATLARFVAEQPSVVIMGATLDRGDSATLIGAMRDRATSGAVFVVLIGDLRGPVHNALDALDIGADRFVGRPLTVKALRFAVMSGLGQGAGPWGTESQSAISVAALAAAAMTPGERRGVRLTPAPAPAVTSTSTSTEVAASEAAGPAASEVAAPLVEAPPVARSSFEAAPPVEAASGTQPIHVAELRARWEALAEELDEIPDEELDDRPTLRAATSVGRPEPDWDVDDGESGEIQVVELEGEAEAELVAARSSLGGEVVDVTEAEVVAELELTDSAMRPHPGFARPVEAFEPPTDDLLEPAFGAPAALARAVDDATPSPVTVTDSVPVTVATPMPLSSMETVPIAVESIPVMLAVSIPVMGVVESAAVGESIPVTVAESVRVSLAPVSARDAAEVPLDASVDAWGEAWDAPDDASVEAADPGASGAVAIVESGPIAGEAAAVIEAAPSSDVEVGAVAAVDSGPTVGAVAAVDSGPTVGAVAAVDSGPQAGAIAAVDSGPQVGAVAVVDSGPQAGAIAAVDSGPTVGAVATVESGPQAGAVAAVDSGPQAGAVAAVDSGPQAGAVAVVDSGPQAGAIAVVDSGPLASAVAAVDSGPTVGAVATVDSGPQAGAVAVVDSGPLASAVAAVDSGPQAGAIAVVDSGPLASAVAAVDSGPQAGAIAVVDSGPLASAVAPVPVAVAIAVEPESAAVVRAVELEPPAVVRAVELEPPAVVRAVEPEPPPEPPEPPAVEAAVEASPEVELEALADSGPVPELEYVFEGTDARAGDSGRVVATEPGTVSISDAVPVAVPSHGALPSIHESLPAVIAVQESSSVAAIPDSEAWPPPELAADAFARPYTPVPRPPTPAPYVEPPELPLREPTMILTDDPPPFAPAGPPPSFASTAAIPSPPPLPAVGARPRSVTIPPPPVAPPRASTRPEPEPDPLVDDDLPFADDFDVVEDSDEGSPFVDSFERGGTGSDAGVITPRPSPAPAAVVRVNEPPPAGGEFARELRRKMSAMAERLFRGDAPAVPFASGPGHDHHTEIDLRGLDDDAALPAAALTDDLGGATYVGELPGPEPQAPVDRGTGGGTGGGTGEVGELRRGAADVPALVARMFAQTFTGKIVFRRGPVEKAIFFDSGRPVFATSSLFHDRMGELLHREGKITREQHDRCRDLVRDTGRRMGEILVERGYLKRRELLPAVRRHIEDIIYSLFAWDAGDYRVVAGDGASNERIRLSRHAAAIILEGVRRKLDHDLLEQLLGPPGTVVTVADRDKLAAVTAVADLSREERAALAALDGVADLDQVARTSGAGLETVYQLAWSLSLLGLVAPRRRADEDGEAGALVGESDLRIDRERVRARSELCADADYFALLGVRRDATGFEIRRAYEAARRDFAPESFPPELRRELAADLDDIASVLDEAYRVLRDDPLRSAYRGHLLDTSAEA